MLNTNLVLKQVFLTDILESCLPPPISLKYVLNFIPNERALYPAGMSFKFKVNASNGSEVM